MKKYVLMVFCFSLILSACSQSEKAKILKHLDEKTSYDISIEFSDRVLNIDIPMLDEEITWSEDGQMYVNLETKILLEAIKRYPKKDLDLIKVVNMHFITKGTNKIVAKVNAESDTFMETDWFEMDIHDVPQFVDYYKFNGDTKKPLTLEQLLEVFRKEGLQLTKAEEYAENIFQQGINGVKPSFYQLSDGVIHFYIFKSNKEGEEGRKDFYDRPIEFIEHDAFEVKNVLVLYVYGKNQDKEITKRIKDATHKLK